ncbi:MAG TPA: hypothetical protein VGH50_01200 [Candidatus Binatia bacterium]
MRIVVGSVVLGMVLFFVASNPRTGVGPGTDDGRSPKDRVTVEERAQKPNSNAQGEWFPDPERGWVRLQQHDQQHDRNEGGVERNRGDNSAVKSRNDRTRWEY